MGEYIHSVYESQAKFSVIIKKSSCIPKAKSLSSTTQKSTNPSLPRRSRSAGHFIMKRLGIKPVRFPTKRNWCKVNWWEVECQPKNGKAKERELVKREIREEIFCLHKRKV